MIVFFGYNRFVQQYFYHSPLNEKMIVDLDEDVLYHLIKVLRKDPSYTFRLCDSEGKIFHAHLIGNKQAEILQFLDEDNELETDLTCIMSLIKNDKLELTIQKLTELGIRRIVLYEAERSVVKLKEEKKVLRLTKIAREAAEQSHRNMIPEICAVNSIKDLNRYKSDHNYICYEAEKNIADLDVKGSISFIIGPEGGFEKNEYEKICELGFESISLGKRILRAETAAIYMSSVIVSKCQ